MADLAHAVLLIAGFLVLAVTLHGLEKRLPPGDLATGGTGSRGRRTAGRGYPDGMAEIVVGQIAATSCCVSTRCRLGRVRPPR